ncbi:DUF4259 domain-containing protein [Clostridium sp. YIM B02505]|uniref:DUF4259 domain-containing protein n=1 Tax=Clostridium yunnanense TaxID=2800325 RepID=A0ABS1EV06_9CLOT|nr:DUF4259 domain-containing protein [Clostridium yunnanense]
MGTWGYGIFDDDTASDIKGDFDEYIKEGLSVTEATESILEEYQEIIEEDEEDGPTVYLALASLQMTHGQLQADIKEIALEIIESGKGFEIWEESGENELDERKKVLNQLKLQLLRQ